MKTVSLGASRPSAVSFRMYDPCPLSFSVNKQSYSVPLGDRLEEAVAAHSLACAWLPPCFSGRRGTTWCRYASTSRWMASATGTPSPGTREVPTHPSILLLSPLLAAFDSLSCCSGRRSRLGDHQLRQEDGQGPQAAGHVRAPDAPVHPGASLPRASFLAGIHSFLAYL
jgi:hypothetical protein